MNKWAGFTQEQLNVLAFIMQKAIDKTPIKGRTPHAIHGEIYTRLRQEMLGHRDLAACAEVLNVLKGRFKYLTCRLSEKQKEQLMTLFNDLSHGGYSRYARNAVVVEKEPEGIDALQLQVAKANKALEEAAQAVKTAEQVAQEIDALEQYIQQGER